MAKVNTPDTLCSPICYKKFGNSNGYGNIIFGFSYFGEDNIFAGIYRRRPCPNGVSVVKMRFYRPHVSRTELQAAQRDKYVAAVAAWKALSEAERQVWRDYAANYRGVKLPIYRGWPVKKLKQKYLPAFRGYDMFRSDYLLTH